MERGRISLREILDVIVKTEEQNGSTQSHKVHKLMTCINISPMQKLNARKASLHRTTAVPEKDKPIWSECLLPEVMSSEDSEDDGSFTVRPLPWRSEKASNFLLGLDHKRDKRRSRKSRIMTFQRKTGEFSERPQPGSVPAWVVKP